MNKFTREFRLIPVVLFATVSLLALKIGGLVASGGYTLATPRPAQANDVHARSPEGKRSWAQETLGYPDLTGSVDKPAAADQNGKGAGKGDPAQPAAAEPPPLKPDAAPVSIDSTRALSPAERAVLERLQERRQELEHRARELDIREGLLTAAEKRIEARVMELKDVEARINAGIAKKDEAEVARLKGIVTMYENMKAKEAARIFDRLDIKILLEVASQINPRRMSDILAQMTPEAAERLTVELATRSNQSEKAPALSDLPKIEGRPGG
ncbi:MAG: MotE family protein [Xanthobacteraceae bacterium]